MTNNYNLYDNSHYHEQDKITQYLKAYYHIKEDRSGIVLTTVIIASIYSSVVFAKELGYDLAKIDLELGSTPRDPILKLTLTI